MPLNALSDHDLWCLIVNDNYRAFTALYERHWFKLYRTAKKYVRDDEQCEEIVHDLFLNIWNRRQFLQITDFSHYLTAAARYQVYAHLKKTTKLHLEYREELSEVAIGPQFNKGQEKLLCDDLETELQEQLSALPQRCREIFLLSRKEQLSNLEISERLGISKRSVENQITSALKHLRLGLKDLALITFFVFCIVQGAII